jgi:hypothetical protein
LHIANLALLKTPTKKKQLVVCKVKITSAKVPKARAPIIPSKKPPKTHAKSPKKVVVVKEVKDVIIY